MRPESSSGNKTTYKEVENFQTARDTIRARLDESLEMHSTQTFQDIVLFDDATDHLLRLMRVLYTPCGNALLIGLGGSGKQSIAKMAVQLVGGRCFHVQAGAGYSKSHFKEDLRSMFRNAGVKCKTTCFLISDRTIADVTFMDYINQYLISGDIHGLFEKEDLDDIAANMRQPFKDRHKGTF